MTDAGDSQSPDAAIDPFERPALDTTAELDWRCPGCGGWYVSTASLPPWKASCTSSECRVDVYSALVPGTEDPDAVASGPPDDETVDDDDDQSVADQLTRLESGSNDGA